MKSSTASKLALYITGNAFLSFILTATVLAIGLLTASVPLVMVSGVMAFGRPFLYCALFNAQPKAEKSTATEAGRRSSNLSLAFGNR